MAGAATVSACINPPRAATLLSFSHGVLNYDVALYFAAVAGCVHIHPLSAQRPVSYVFKTGGHAGRRRGHIRPIVEPAVRDTACDAEVEQVPGGLAAPRVENQRIHLG